MKVNLLAACAALTCCAAIEPCPAQILVIGDSAAANGSSSSAKFKMRQVAQSENPLDNPGDLFSSATEAAAQTSASPELVAPIVNEAPSITNPFDNYSSADDSQTAAPALGSESPATGDGQPVGRHHRQHADSRSMVDTILQYGAYQDIPNASFMPVQWPSMNGNSSPTNPIGHYMLRNWCVDGLWASYPAQRAAQCQAIHDHIAGCPPNHCNRYLLPGYRRGCAVSATSDCWNGSGYGGAACDSCPPGVAAALPSVPPELPVQEVQIPVAPVSVQVPTPANPADPQPSDSHAGSATDVVALLPAYVPAQQIR